MPSASDTRSVARTAAPRALLFISGGVEALPAIRQARAMGTHVVVSDADARAPGCLEADEVLVASTYDVDETVAAARRFAEEVRPLDGAICVAADVPVTLAAVGEALGLRTITRVAGRLASDKLAMKQRFRAAGVDTPWFSAVESVEHLRALVRPTRPYVLKPVDSRGARGVLRVDRESNLDRAFAEAHAHSRSGRVMIEEFLNGPQISTESLIVAGRVHTVGFADRNYEFLERFAPHIIENGADLPTRLSAAERDAIAGLVARAAASLEIDTGVVKGDIVWNRGRPRVIELAARMSGGYLCTHMIPLSNGVDLIGCAIRTALGDVVADAELRPTLNRGVAQRWLFPSPGLVVHVEGVERAEAHEGVALVDVRVRPRDVVGPLESHVNRAGMVLAHAETRAQAARIAEDALSEITVITEPASI